MEFLVQGDQLALSSPVAIFTFFLRVCYSNCSSFFLPASYSSVASEKLWFETTE
jgi:hypothetical protein